MTKLTDKQAKMGRPSKYSAELVSAICGRMMKGQSLREICRDDDMPSRETIYNWLSSKPDFLDRYTQAREIQADHMFDEMLEIADDGSNDWMTRKQGNDEVEVVNHEHIQRSKLRIDTRKWSLARMSPTKYGDRVIQQHDSTDAATGEPSDDRAAVRRVAHMLLAAVAQTEPENVIDAEYEDS